MLGLMIIAAVIGSDPPSTQQQLESYLSAGNDSAIIEWFRGHPDDALPFIDSYLEGGLKMIEDGKDAAQSKASFDTGVRFAALADTAFYETIFSLYAKSFAGWSSKEQKEFRRGQQLVREGRQALDAGRLTPASRSLATSLAITRSLNDAWGMAMCYRGLGRVRLAEDKLRTARQNFSEASWIYNRLRLRRDEIKSLVGLASANSKLGAPHTAIVSLEQARGLLRPEDPQELVKMVTEPLVRAYTATGQIDKTRQLIPPAPPTTAPAKGDG